MCSVTRRIPSPTGTSSLLDVCWVPRRGKWQGTDHTIVMCTCRPSAFCPIRTSCVVWRSSTKTTFLTPSSISSGSISTTRSISRTSSRNKAAPPCRFACGHAPWMYTTGQLWALNLQTTARWSSRTKLSASSWRCQLRRSPSVCCLEAMWPNKISALRCCVTVLQGFEGCRA